MLKNLKYTFFRGIRFVVGLFQRRPKKIRLFKSYEEVSDRQRRYNQERISAALAGGKSKYLQGFYALNKDCPFFLSYVQHFSGDELVKWEEGKRLYDLAIARLAKLMLAPLRVPLDYQGIARKLLVKGRIK